MMEREGVLSVHQETIQKNKNIFEFFPYNFFFVF